MGLVEYSDSENEIVVPVPTKKRRLNDNNQGPEDGALPPLPPSFRDLYSSAVRMSNSDDPNLHGGRKRIVPHVEGNWSAHVYLEWHPSPAESSILTKLIATCQDQESSQSSPSSVHSLLTDSLSVPLPLHISLSAPLVLRSESKDAFLTATVNALQSASTKPSLTVSPTELVWHSNQERTRSFLVLKVSRPLEDEGALNALLGVANGVAGRFGEKQLYAAVGKRAREDGRVVERDASSAFHISLAWSLEAQDHTVNDGTSSSESERSRLMGEVRAMKVSFSEVKVRLGKDVTTIKLGRAKKHGRGIMG